MIFISLYYVSTPSAYAEGCTKADRKSTLRLIKSSRLKVAKYLKERDIEEDVKELKLYESWCGLNLVHEETYDFWLKTSWKHESERWKEKAKYNSGFHDVSDELDKYKHFALKAGVKPSIVNDFYSEVKKNGQISERKKQDSCKPVDLRGPKLGPVRDQGATNWCYALVAADLLGHKLGKKISGSAAAMSYNNAYHPKQYKNAIDLLLFRDARNILDSQLKEGNTQKTIEAVLKEGLCLESDLSTEDTGHGDLYTHFKNIEELKWKSKLSDTDPKGSVTKICNSNFNMVNSLFKGLSIEDFVSVFESSTDINYLDKLADKSCQRFSPPQKLKVKTIDNHFEPKRTTYEKQRTWLAKKMEMFEIIDEQLDKGNLLGLGYNMKILRNRHHRSDHGDHASVVVGRRVNKKTNECEYLIRNSFGRSCDTYDSSYDCEEGNIWIPKSTLVGASVNVDYIE